MQELLKRALAIFGDKLEDLAIALETSPLTLKALQAGRDVPASIVLGLLAVVEDKVEGVVIQRREDAELKASKDGQVACRKLGVRTKGAEIRLAGDRTEFFPIKRGQVGSIYILRGTLDISIGYSEQGVRVEEGDYVELPAQTSSIHNVSTQVARLLVFWSDDFTNS